MEFNEKLQQLRKQKGMTQEELAERLYVSRTAVSKWESGRGYPNIDSLKALAKFFSVSLDELLSGEEALRVAEEDNRQRVEHFCNMLFGLLDISVAVLFFLPLFGQKAEGKIYNVSLLSLTGPETYLMIVYFAVVTGLVTAGIFRLALQNCGHPLWQSGRNKISLALNLLGALVFIISLQPYAASLLFVFLVIKLVMLIKWH